MLAPCREMFEIPDEVAYLNCAYMSPLTRAARLAGERGVAAKSTPWGVTAEDFFVPSERVRSLFAALVGASSEDVAFAPAASYGLSLAAANLSLARGQSVLLLAEQFPSNVHPWRARAREVGAEVVFVPRPADHDWTSAILERIGSDTATVAIPALHWADGAAIDLLAIRRRTDEVGAALVLDLSQSLGALPFDARIVRPDFMACPAYKWLLGPYSMGFLYVAPQWQTGKPLEHNWIARAGSENFAGLVEYRDEFQPGARRFDVGERSNFALMPILESALRQVLDWGVSEIQATLAARNRDLARRATTLGFEPVPERFRCGHYLGLRRPRGLPDDLVARLASERVYVSRRGSYLRVTPHLYNTDKDVERLLEALERAGLP